MLLGSRFCFFNRGATSACFMQRGTTPDEMDELINCARNGANPSVTCFSSDVGNGWSAQDVISDLSMSLRISVINVVHWGSAARPLGYTGALRLVRIQGRCDSRIVAYRRTNRLDLRREKIGETC